MPDTPWEEIERRLRDEAVWIPWPPLRGEPRERLLAEVWPHAEALFRDPEPLIRRQTLELLASLRPPDAVDWLLTLAGTYAALYAEEVVQGTRLRERLFTVMVELAAPPHEERLLGAIVALAGDQLPGDATAGFVARMDPALALDLARRFGGTPGTADWMARARRALGKHHPDAGRTFDALGLVLDAPCDRCPRYFGDWRSGGDVFPQSDWDILESVEHPVGTHGGSTAFDGVARCRRCGRHARFGCSYGPGYAFSAVEWP
jgi:hypothetical protein